MVYEISRDRLSNDEGDSSEVLLLSGRMRRRKDSDIRRLGLSYSLRVEDTETTGEGAPWYTACLILTNVIVGVGILNYPRAFVDSGGLQWALPTLAVIVLFIIYGLIILGECTDISRKETLEDLVQYYTGKTGLLICNILVIIHNLGACITFLIIIADQTDFLMRLAFGDSFCHAWYLDRSFTMPLIAIVFILPLCFVKNMADFKITSYIGVFTTVYIVFFVIWHYFEGPRQKESSDIEIKPTSWDDVFKVVPTICFSFEAHIEAVPLFYTLRAPQRQTFAIAVTSSIILSTVIYTTVGVFGLLTFGPAVSADMLTDYPQSEPMVIVGVVMLAIKAITTYPIVLFCTRLVVDDLLEYVSNGRCTDLCRHCIGTVGLFVSSVLIAVIVPSIGGAISLLGFTGAIFVFIFPGIFFVVEHSKWDNAKAISKTLLGSASLVVGALVGGISTTQSVQRIINGDFSSRDVTCS